MLIRRLKELKWIDYFIELIIVFIGVTLAFYFNQYSETNKSKSQEITYLTNILEDLNEEEESCKEIIDVISEELEKLKYLIKKVKSKHINVQDSIARPIDKMSGLTIYHPDVPTYHSLLNNGESLKITNLKLRSLLDGYYAYYPTLKLRYQDVHETKSNKLIPYISEHYNFYQKKVIHKQPFYSDMMQNILFEILEKEYFKRNTYKKILKRTTELKKQVEEELKSKQ